MKNKNLIWLAVALGGLYVLGQKKTAITAIPVTANTPQGAKAGVLVSDRAGNGVLVSDRSGGGVLVADKVRGGVLVSD